MRDFVASGLPVLYLAAILVADVAWDYLKRDRR